MHKKMTREERVAMLKMVSEKVKAGEVKGVQAVSVLQKENVCLQCNQSGHSTCNKD